MPAQLKDLSTYAWRAELSVGNDVIDGDHKVFFNLAEMFQNASHDEENKIVIESVMSTLTEYVAGHFKREELAMLSAEYPGLEAHMREHARFTETLHQLMQSYYAGSQGATEKLGYTLSQWLTHHIEHIDHKYKDWIKEKDVDPRPLYEVAGCLKQDDIDEIW